MDILRIPTENAEADQWKLLSQFSYPTNIRRYMDEKGHTSVPEETINYIAGCIRQGEAYFIASKTAPLDISPLLVYYGSSNLLGGAAALINGERLPIRSHGVKVKPDTWSRGADVQITPVDAANGALQLFAEVFSRGCDLVSGGDWTVEEVLGSIPDLKVEFENCYEGSPTFTIPIERVIRRKGSLERVLPADIARHGSPQVSFKNITDFEKAYLTPQWRSGLKYIMLYPKQSGPEVGTYSIYGQKYLQIAHAKKNGLLDPSQLILMHMGTFALGYLSRYHPEFWNPFVRADQTGERLVIERFIAICQRYLPNLVLNELRGMRIQFIHQSDRVIDLAASLTETELREIVQEMKTKGEI